MTVRHLALQAGVCQRQLKRRVIDALGMPPKVLIRLARLQLTLRQIRSLVRTARSSAHERLGVLASRAGFADASQMAREFRAFTGHVFEVLRERMRASSPHDWVFDLPEDWFAAGYR